MTRQKVLSLMSVDHVEQRSQNYTKKMMRDEEWMEFNKTSKWGLIQS